MGAESATGTVEPFGDTAVLVSRLGRADVRAVAAALRRAGHRGVLDVVGGLGSVLVVLDPHVLPLDDALAWLGLPDAWRDPGTSSADTLTARDGSRQIVVPVAFGGPDTDEVCSVAGIEPEELEALLTSADLTVATVGFSPGFAYLEGLPPPLDSVPRKPRPRPVVPAGSVALAAGYAAVYPQATPGGWQLIGRSALRLFDPSAPPYALLQPGDRVRFARDTEARTGSRRGTEPITEEAAPVSAVISVRSRPEARAPLRPRPGSRPALLVEQPGVLSVVQDGGRRGLAHLGVPDAGPADPLAHGLANRLLGNAPDAAAVEIVARGPAIRALRDVFAAVVGAGPLVKVDGREVGHSHVVPVSRGQRLEVGSLEGGFRTYLAVAGGVLAPAVLGSRSTDTLTWLGPGPLKAGDELEVGDSGEARLGDHLSAEVSALLAGALVRAHATTTSTGSTAWTVRVVEGPHAAWLEAGLASLCRVPFTVSATSDRTGIRLEPHGSPLARRPGEVESQGMVTGAVQVPPDGRPIALGPDHATLGGYPVVAVIVRTDLWVLGQCRGGDTIRFTPVDLGAAARAFRDRSRLLAAAVVGRYPYRDGPA